MTYWVQISYFKSSGKRVQADSEDEAIESYFNTYYPGVSMDKSRITVEKLIKYQKDCFAFAGIGGHCKILRNTTTCENCKFYKTKETYRKDKLLSKENAETKGYYMNTEKYCPSDSYLGDGKDY